MIEITIPGEPIAWGRTRTRGGQHFMPKRTRTWQGIARTAAMEALGDTHALVTGPLGITVVCYMPLPTSWPQWKRDAALDGRILPAGKPDTSNLLKNVEDAFNQVVWGDDAQIVSAEVDKVYSESPRMVVQVEELEALAPQGARKQDLPSLPQ